MSSAFLGKTIEVRLHSGAAVKGKITSVDGLTGSLGVLTLDGTPFVVGRTDIADLSLIEESKTEQTLHQTPPQLQDPAIISFTQGSATVNGPPVSASTSSVPLAPAAMLASRSDLGQAGKTTKGARGRDKKAVLESGTSSRNHTEDETDYITRKGKKKQPMQRRALHAEESDLDEDFDFDKALRSFDKRKIWQEIKTTDQTDLSLLLVSHNRMNGSNDKHAARFNGRNGQEKLGMHEPVLSPSPTASHTSLPALDGPVAESNKPAAAGEDESELQRVRGNALQQELENSRLRDEIRRLRVRASVLEALGGIELQHTGEEFDGISWRGVVYESVAAHADSRRSSMTRGSVIFHLKTFTGDETKIRYLGVLANESDINVIDRLPSQYKAEMGLKTESASVFMRRLKEAVQSR